MEADAVKRGGGKRKKPDKRLLDLFGRLARGQQDKLIAFAEFLAARAPGAGNGKPAVIPRPARETVTMAIRRLVHTYLGLWGFGSMPLVTSPGLPAELLKMLRDAWAKIFADAEFQEDIAKRNWEARPVFGEELQNLAKDVVNQPPEVSAALKRILSQ